MALFETTKKIWQIVLAFLGLLATILGIISYFEEKKPQITYDITTNSNVFDLNTNLSKLDIIYDSVSLKKSSQNLKIINIRVENTGNEDLLKSFYDENDPLGVVVENGIIIEKPEVGYSSNDYLKHHALVKLLTDNKIEFSNVIIEKSEFFNVKLLILHKKNRNPKIIPVGKVAGMKNIFIVDSQTKTSYKSIFHEIFSGSLWVNIIRVLLSFIIVIFSLFALIIVLAFFQDYIETRRKKRILESFKKSNIYSPKFDPIIDIYENYGDSAVITMDILLRKEETLNREYINHRQELSRRREYRESPYINKEDTFPRVRHQGFIFEEMINKEIINRDKHGVLTINNEEKELVRQFVEFLNKYRRSK